MVFGWLAENGFGRTGLMFHIPQSVNTLGSQRNGRPTDMRSGAR